MKALKVASVLYSRMLVVYSDHLLITKTINYSSSSDLTHKSSEWITLSQLFMGYALYG